jgi:hypothetical protein
MLKFSAETPATRKAVAAMRKVRLFVFISLRFLYFALTLNSLNSSTLHDLLSSDAGKPASERSRRAVFPANNDGFDSAQPPADQSKTFFYGEFYH